jgi:hypothetical protein
MCGHKPFLLATVSTYRATTRNSLTTLLAWNETEIGSHVTKRRVLNNAFSDRAVRSAEPFVIQHVDRWCDLIVETGHFGSSWTPSINMAEWSNYLVLDMFTELCFGKSFHIKEPGNEKYRFVPHLMTEYAELLHLVYLPLLIYRLMLSGCRLLHRPLVVSGLD